MSSHTKGDEHGEDDAPSTTRPAETGGTGFAAAAVEPASTMVNLAIPGDPAVRYLLVARFPRGRLAAMGLAITAIILVVPFLALTDFGPVGSAVDNTSGLPNWAISLTALVIGALIFGWIGILMVITAIRGGYVALTQAGIFVQTGLKSVLIPWTAIEGAAQSPGANGRDPALDVYLLRKVRVPGWAWPAALSPVLLGSSGRKFHLRAWWIQPVPVDVLLDIVRYLTSHPEVRPRIGSADPEAWLNAAP